MQRSNIALSGEEVLGDGWSAVFRLSHRFDPDTGTREDNNAKPFWYDESTVGVKGPLGTVRLGRALDAIYSQDWQFDPWAYFDRIASPAWDLWHYNYPSDPHANLGQPDWGRLSSGIFYDSPVINGFSLHLSGSPEKEPGDANKPMGASLTYVSDGLTAMLGHAKNAAAGTNTFLGLRGDVYGVTLMGAYDRSKQGASTANATTVGAQYTVGAVRFNLGWGTLAVNGVERQRTLGTGALYALSKRTSVYADVAQKRFADGSDMTYGAGVAHSF